MNKQIIIVAIIVLIITGCYNSPEVVNVSRTFWKSEERKKVPLYNQELKLIDSLEWHLSKNEGLLYNSNVYYLFTLKNKDYFKALDSIYLRQDSKGLFIAWFLPKGKLGMKKSLFLVDTLFLFNSSKVDYNIANGMKQSSWVSNVEKKDSINSSYLISIENTEEGLISNFKLLISKNKGIEKIYFFERKRGDKYL